MRALVTSPPGGWPNTTVTNIETRSGQAGELLVRIHAVGLNPADNFQIEGRYPGGPRPPFIPGRDACGTIIQGEARWLPGDSVVILQSSTTNLQHGTLCEQQWISAENVAKKPDGWSDQESAAAPLVYQTAWKALFDVGRLMPEESVVVTGASGGVGLAAVQLARAKGATVVALSRSEEKRRRLIELGAQHAFSPDDQHLKESIFDAIRNKGVSLVIENVGGPSLATSVHLLGVHGRISVVGLLAGVEGTVPIAALMFKRASIHGVLVTEDPPEKTQRAFSEIVELMNQARFRPTIDSQFTLDSVADAFEKLKGDVFGKVVVNVHQPV